MKNESATAQLVDALPPELWEHAKKRHIVRSLLTGFASALAVGVFYLFTDHGKFTATPTSSGIRWGVAGGLVVFIVMGAVALWQVSSSPERFVSPVLGLDPAKRRQAKVDVRNAQPSNDSELRAVEVAHATQQQVAGASGRWSGYVNAAIFTALAAMTASTQEWARAVFWLLLAGVNVTSSELRHRRGKTAERFLGALH